MNLAWRAFLIPAALAGAAIVMRTLMREAPAGLAVDLAQPLVVATNWGAFGAALLGVLLAALAAGGFGYWWLIGQRGGFSMPALLTILAIALIAAWYVPVLFSSDVYAYAAYGELARLGGDPYVHVPLVRGNALLTAAAWQWGNAVPICVYGPAFVGLTRAVVGALAPIGTLAQLDGLRVLSSIAFLLCAPLAYAAVAGNRTSRLHAATMIGLNPAAIWCAAEGHNDAIALAIVLAGFAVGRRGFLGIGATIVAFSALVKPPGALAALALAMLQRRARIGAAIGIVLAAAFSIPLLVGVAMRLAPHARYAAQASLQAIFEPLGTLAALFVAAGVCALLAANGIARLRRGNNEGWVWLGLGAWVLVPNPYPWYGIWLLALATLAPGTRAAAVAILLSLSSLLRYVPDAVGMPNSTMAVTLGVLATLPLLGLVPAWYNERLV